MWTYMVTSCTTLTHYHLMKLNRKTEAFHTLGKENTSLCWDCDPLKYNINPPSWRKISRNIFCCLHFLFFCLLSSSFSPLWLLLWETHTSWPPDSASTTRVKMQVDTGCYFLTFWIITAQSKLSSQVESTYIYRPHRTGCCTQCTGWEWGHGIKSGLK